MLPLPTVPLLLLEVPVPLLWMGQHNPASPKAWLKAYTITDNHLEYYKLFE